MLNILYMFHARKEILEFYKNVTSRLSLKRRLIWGIYTLQGLSKMLVNFSVVSSPYKDNIIHQYIFVSSIRVTAQQSSPDLNPWYIDL
jgi:hypothetical protein